ncbi:T9SS type A sorting domain-containing protein [Ferruginibacter sp. SUN002]|uniref:T9SS type A sorting domain-containing protein n=1 Tax=Ferruginibacter sp. SUN002 TaxID=2937789 RepID=UPI003D35DB0A
MKKIYLTFLTAFTFAAASAQFTHTGVPFTTGNLVVLRLGNGSTISGSATAGSIEEYTKSGTLVQSFYLDTVTNPITFAGSASSEGFISRSTDKSVIVVAGYGTITGTATPNTATAATIARVVAVIDKTSAVDLSTRMGDAYNGSNIRGAASTNGTDIFTSGNGGSGQGATAGIRYTTKGSTTSVLVNTGLSNTRAVSIYNNQLYATSGSGTFFGVSSVGTGVPTTAGNASTILPGFPVASGPSPYAFDMNPAGDVIYVADDRASASGGGIQKWTLSAGTWSLAYTLNSGLTTGAGATASGARGVVVDWTTTNPTLYVTTTGTSQNKIAVGVDAGAASTFTEIASAPSGTGFRGIAFAPELATQPVKLSGFTTQKKTSSVTLNWVTEQESNTKSFIVLRSPDGSTWSEVSTVAAAGTSNSILNYTITDNTPLNGFNYYRLKQVSEDGTYTMSDIRKVLFSTNYKVMVTPNPARDFINVYISKNNGTNTIVRISDINGKLVRSESSALSTISIPTNGMAKGIYFVKVIDGTNITTKKISVQ